MSEALPTSRQRFPAARHPLVRRLTRNITWSFLSQLIGKAGVFLASLLLAHRLGVESFGTFVLAQSIALSLYWVTVDFGTTMYGLREVAKHRQDPQSIINPLLTLRLTAGLVVALLYPALLSLLPIGAEEYSVFAAAGCYLFGFAVFSDWIPKGLEKFQLVAMGNIVSAFSFLAGTIFLVHGPANTATAAWIWGLSFLPGGAVILWLSAKTGRITYRPDFRLQVWRSHLKHTIFFTTAAALMSLYAYVPLLATRTVLGRFEAGLISPLYTLIMNLSSPAYLIVLACYPVIASLYDEDRRRFWVLHRILVGGLAILGFSMAVVGTLFARPILVGLFGPAFAPASSAFAVIVWTLPLMLVRFVYGMTMFGTGHQRQYNTAALCGLTTTLLASLLLIPAAGVVGGAWAYVLGELGLLAGFRLVARSLSADELPTKLLNDPPTQPNQNSTPQTNAA